MKESIVMIAFYTPEGMRERKLRNLGATYLSILASNETEIVILMGLI
jgi:hypothetical protein